MPTKPSKKATLAELAAQYEVSVRTLSRLRARGVDVHDRDAVFAEFYLQRSAPCAASAQVDWSTLSQMGVV